MGDVKRTKPGGWFAAAAVMLVLAVPALGSTGLSEVQLNGYLIWLHALEEAIATREAEGQPEPRLLYPRQLATGRSQDGEDLLDVARALEDLEARPRLLQEPPGRSPLHAINRARNHANLAEHDSSLVWYLEAVRRDTSLQATTDLGPEIMATAIAADAEEVVWGRLAGALRQSPETAPGALLEVELGCRFLLARADTAGLTELVAIFAERPHLRQGRLAYWEAFSLNWLGRWSESLAILKSFLTGDGRTHGLDEAQRAWVLTAIADQLLLLDDHETAAGLYRALASSTVPSAAAWAACQVAALDLIAGRFLAAGTAFERLCRQSGDDPWQRYACELARLSDELERLRREGEPHGIATHYQP